MAVNVPAGFEVKPDGSIGPVDAGGFDAAFGGPPPIGTNINNTQQSQAPGYGNFGYGGGAPPSSAATLGANSPGPIQYPPYGPQLPPKSRPQNPQSPPGLSDAASWLWSHMPTPTYNPAQHGPSKNPIDNPIVFAGQPRDPGGWNEAFNPKGQTTPFTALAPRGGRQPVAPSQGGGGGDGDGSWLGSPNMNDAALGDQIMPGGGGLFDGGRPPVQGPLAALALGPHFTQVSNMGGPALSALDLSGHYVPTTGNARAATYVPGVAPPAPPSYDLGYGGGGGRRGSAPARAAPSRMRSQAPQDPGSAFWSTSGPGVGLPAAKGPGFWAVQGPGVGLPANKGPGFWAIHGPGVGMPSSGPVNQPGFWGVHGRGVGFGGNQ